MKKTFAAATLVFLLSCGNRASDTDVTKQDSTEVSSYAQDYLKDTNTVNADTVLPLPQPHYAR